MVCADNVYLLGWSLTLKQKSSTSIAPAKRWLRNQANELLCVTNFHTNSNFNLPGYDNSVNELNFLKTASTNDPISTSTYMFVVGDGITTGRIVQKAALRSFM